MKKPGLLCAIAVFAFAAPAAAAFPEIAGWTRAGEVQTFSPDTLWEHINGAAEVFLQYGFLKLETCELESGDTTVAVGVYDMATSINAFGIYRTELPRGAETIDIGAEAFLSPPYQCLLLKDRFYVKVEVYGGEISAASGRALVEAFAAALPGSDRMPDAIRALPKNHMVAGSQKYTREAFLGLRELELCVSATYEPEPGTSYQAFRMMAPSGQTEEDVWKRLAAKWKAAPHEPEPVLAKKVPYTGLVGVMRTRDGILGVAGCEDEAELLRRLAKHRSHSR